MNVPSEYSLSQIKSKRGYWGNNGYEHAFLHCGKPLEEVLTHSANVWSLSGRKPSIVTAIAT